MDAAHIRVCECNVWGENSISVDSHQICGVWRGVVTLSSHQGAKDTGKEGLLTSGR